MARQILILFLLTSSLTLFGQSLDQFKKDFHNALDEKFSAAELNEMFTEHSTFLTPHSDVTQLSANVKGQPIEIYPLADFRSDKLYIDNIYRLVNSNNSNHRILAYLVIAGSGDTTFETQLLRAIKNEKDKGCLIWSGMALLHLKTNHTTALFDFLVENETFGDAHMLPLFIKLNKDSLQQTAYQRIDSDNPTARILAVQMLSYTELNSKTEALLLKAIKEWDMNAKGYAIHSVKELQMGNLLEVFRPLLDNSKIRSIALQALANSPTELDGQYLFDIAIKQDTLSEDLLDAFYESRNIASLKYWLQLTYTKPMPEKYYFSVSSQPLIFDDRILGELQIALQNSKNTEILGELVRALGGRSDEISTDILLNLLNHEDSTVRYWAATALRGNHSLEVLSSVLKLLRQPARREVSLTELVIENKIDTLQALYENIYKTEQSLDWQRSSIEYLSTFPSSDHKEIFKRILKDQKVDTFIKRSAALGLGRLKDKSSVDLIISVCREESEASDYNAQTFLIALSMIKGHKAKYEISKYKDSEEQMVRELVAEILDLW
jgi:hypothetical protein